MSDRPNIVFTHVDQMHYKAVSALGNRYLRTPNIDRILSEGTSFSLSHSANPVCCPARASWYTGRMSSEHGVVANQRPLLETIPDLGTWMGERGYSCYYTGKWHVPNRQVNQSFTLLPGGGRGERGDAGVATSASGFLQNYDGQNPFFLNVGFLNPHDCCYLTFAPKDPATKFDLTDILEEELPPVPGGYEPATPFKSPEGGIWDEDRIRLYSYYHYRQVEMVDAEIGRVYRALRNSKFAVNTLFIFTSDHGEMLGNWNQFKKGVLHEASLRVPLAFSWPGRIEGGRRNSDHLVSGVDIPATILDFAGLESLPKLRVARSLRPLLEGHNEAWRDYLVAESSALNRAVRHRQFKAIFGQKGLTRLFNLEEDPSEVKDLADKASGRPIIDKLRKLHNECVDSLELHPDYRGFGKV